VTIGGQDYNYVFDGAGSVANLTQPSGQPILGYSFDAFGVLRQQFGPNPPGTVFGWLSLPSDQATGLDVLPPGQGNYDASTARTLQPIPYTYQYWGMGKVLAR
jgi:hypothetical protein